MPWRIDDRLRAHLLAQEESGLGYQVIRRDRDRCLVLNAEVALAFDRPDVLSDGDLKWIRGHMEAASGRGVRRLARAGRALDALSTADWQVEGHGSYPSQTVPGEVLMRYSAFSNDRRIAADGTVLAGTYCTTETDAHVVPSGLAAVARYALPNPNPAVHRFDLAPAPNSPILCGTVTSNYGQAGGGVEVRLGKASQPGGAVFRRIRIAER